MKLSNKILGRGAWLAALLAVAALPAMAGDALTVTVGPHGTTLALAGATPFHATTNIVSDARLVEIPNSAGVAALWEETWPDRSSGYFYAVSLDGQTFARVRETSYTVRLRYANFDPLVGTPEVDWVLAAPATSSLYLVQFVVPPLEAFRDEIGALGGVALRFMADHTHIMSMPAEVADQVAQLPYVRWVGPFHVAYKLDEAILEGLAQGMPDEAATYSIEAFVSGPEQQNAIGARIVGLGGAVQSTTPGAFQMNVILTPGQLLEVVKMDELHFIDPRGEWEVDMDIVRQISGTNYLETMTGYTGQGVRAEVADSGANVNHVEFQGPPGPPLVHSPPIGLGSHGAAVYGVCFAEGIRPQARGIMPDAEQGIVTEASRLRGVANIANRYKHTGELVDPKGPFRAVFQTNSTGDPRTRNYTSISAAMDNNLFNFDIVHCQSMSNAGLTPDVRPQAWAKNIIGAGGITHHDTLTRTDDYSSGSTGPAADNRIKPDLAHFYDNSYTTYSSSTTGYGQFSGTSNATPCTCAHVGLIFQMWHEGVWAGHGGGASVFDSKAHLATAKAIAINTAYRYNWKVGGANSNMWRDRQGWGMVDMKKAYDMRDKTFIVDETDLLTPLATNAYDVTVEAGEPELLVTMCYLDPQGPTSSTQHRINDLSLRVTSPSSTVYWGNNGLRDDNYSSSGGSSNTKDTVENVFIKDPEAGTWKVEVIGDEIVEDSHVETPALDADYGLVVAGIKLSAKGDMNCDGKVDFDDIDPFVLALSGSAAYYAQYPNCNWLNGDINGDSTVNTADIDPFVAVFSP